MNQGEINYQRAAVVREALLWINTPYHSHAKVRGSGADCITVLAGAFEGAGVIEHITIPEYEAQWHLHHSQELYLLSLGPYCDEMPGPPERRPMPADVMLTRFGHTFSHGALVLSWPLCLHAFQTEVGKGRVSRFNAETDGKMMFVTENRHPDHGRRRERKFFRLKEWAP